MQHSHPHILLQEILGKAVSLAVLAKVLTHSSFIHFDDADSVIFKKGEYVRGFYLILKGTAYAEVNSKKVRQQKGYMIGLQSFLKKEYMATNWFAEAQTSTLFIDRKCFETCFENDEVLKDFVEKQLRKKSEKAPKVVEAS